MVQILQQLDQCKSYPDFNNYLAFIFAQGDSLPIEVCGRMLLPPLQPCLPLLHS
jgi:hypothetical protein